MTQSNQPDFFHQLTLPNDETALNWVAQQNRRTTDKFAQSGRFQQARETILRSLNDQQNIPWGSHYHQTVYHFWQDDEHPRGIWRRTSESSYLTDKPDWETVLDLERLNEDENADWRFSHADLLYPDYTRALIYLSSGGDACEIREFDLLTKSFITDGFFLPESKSSACWVDENTLLLALDAGGDTLTHSGYPRCVSRWRRGTSPQESVELYAGKVTDISVTACHDVTPGYEKDLVICSHDLYHSSQFQLTGQDEVEAIAIPGDATTGFLKEWLLITLNSDWHSEGQTYPVGTLLATDYSAFKQGARNFTTLFTPDAHTTLVDYNATRDYLLLNLVQDVVGKVTILALRDNQWRTVQHLALPDFTSVRASAIDVESNRYQIWSEGFLHPCSLSYGDLDDQSLRRVKQDPACFDATPFEVTQHFATSQDGTRVPYFQIAAKGLELTGKHPVLLYGYGGFEVSLTPDYLRTTGATWLQKGGIYVMSNIRGGGEYGPQWHQATLKEHRHRSFEDFAAVAGDLIARKVTCAARLAGRGGSNGGLLIGNMLTDYPELFGALLSEVPLLDMLSYADWLAGPSWIAEYGDPESIEDCQWLLRYSPYDKVSADKHYPPVLFTTGTHDDRVSPAHARRMVALMQQQGHSHVWLYEETDAGHCCAPENSQMAFYEAMVEEFLWQMLTED